MEAFFVALGRAMYERVWLSYRSTILGLLVTALGEVLNYTLNTVPDPRIHALCALVTTVFVGWKDKKVKEGSIKLLLILLLSASAVQAAAGTPSARVITATLADVVPSDPPPAPPPTKPQIGGCFSSGKFCIGPSVSLTVAAVNLTTKRVEGAFSPGVGLGLTMNSGQWYSAGLGVYMNLDPGANNAAGAALLSFLNGYAKVGLSKGFIGDTSTRLLLGVGIDL